MESSEEFAICGSLQEELTFVLRSILLYLPPGGERIDIVRYMCPNKTNTWYVPSDAIDRFFEKIERLQIPGIGIHRRGGDLLVFYYPQNDLETQIRDAILAEEL